MKIHFRVTDQGWFDYLRLLAARSLASGEPLDEVNFWQPSPDSQFGAIGPGDLLLFKLHRGPRTEYQDLISGGGIFARYSILPIWQQQNIFNLDKEALRIEEERARYGKETTFRPRLGQSTFQAAVLESYRRSCAITEEHSLPALEAAHIKPYGDSGPHEVFNGLLLRVDVHRLFDRGYITVTPDYHIEVSRRLREEYKNGRYYYPFHGRKLHHLPPNPADRPQKELLAWHNEKRFFR